MIMSDKDRKDGTHCSKSGWLFSALQKKLRFFKRSLLSDHSEWLQLFVSQVPYKSVEYDFWI